MKKHNLALVILMALGVTACGSGGGSSTKAAEAPKTAQTNKSQKPSEVTPPKTTPSQPTEPPKTAPSQPAEPPKNTPLLPNVEKIPAEDNVFSKNANYKSVRFEYPRQKGKIEVVVVRSSSNDKNRLIIDDKNEVEIFPAGFNTKKLSVKEANLTKLAVRNDHTLWSVFDDKSQKFLYIFANGVNPTQNIDALKGSIKYQGHGYHAYLQADKSHVINDSQVNMTANFDNKTLTGEIKSLDNSFAEVKFGAYITNNAFQGKMNDVIVEGGFFGPEAKEAIAQYRNEKEQSFGVFGVAKQ